MSVMKLRVKRSRSLLPKLTVGTRQVSRPGLLSASPACLRSYQVRSAGRGKGSEQCQQSALSLDATPRRRIYLYGSEVTFATPIPYDDRVDRPMFLYAYLFNTKIR